VTARMSALPSGDLASAARGDYFVAVASHSLSLHVCEGDPICVNSDVVSVTSPARSVRAVKFTRSCDGSGQLSTQVSIVTTGQPLTDEPGNTFAVDGKADLLLFWVDGKHLAISGAGDANRQLQNVLVNGVRVTYEDRPR